MARKASYKSIHQHRLGCVIVKNNTIISIGTNSIKTHPKSNHPFKSTHAEIDAIASADIQDLYKADLYVYRETKAGLIAMSYPCSSCLELIKKIGIKNIHYTCNTGIKTKRIS